MSDKIKAIALATSVLAMFLASIPSLSLVGYVFGLVPASTAHTTYDWAINHGAHLIGTFLAGAVTLVGALIVGRR